MKQRIVLTSPEHGSRVPLGVRFVNVTGVVNVPGIDEVVVGAHLVPVVDGRFEFRAQMGSSILHIKARVPVVAGRPSLLGSSDRIVVCREGRL